jgi:hypothetical protein
MDASELRARARRDGCFVDLARPNVRARRGSHTIPISLGGSAVQILQRPRRIVIPGGTKGPEADQERGLQGTQTSAGHVPGLATRSERPALAGWFNLRKDHRVPWSRRGGAPLQPRVARRGGVDVRGPASERRSQRRLRLWHDARTSWSRAKRVRAGSARRALARFTFRTSIQLSSRPRMVR